MSSNLPALVSPSVDRTTVAKSVSYLQSKQAQIATFSGAEDLATAEPEPKDLIYHFGVLKNALVKTLWPEQFFIGSSILDDLLFEAISGPGASDPLGCVLEEISTAGIHEPGMIVYPLHSFGVLGLGIANWMKKTIPYIDLPEAGIAITIQTNSMSRTLDFLEYARNLFGIPQSVPAETVKHHRRVALEWLERNQLLAVKVSASSGYGYEHQHLLTIKLEIATTLIFMLSVMEPSRDEELLRASSSSRINNWQTLDINHYLVIERTPKPSEELSPRRIPMNVKRTELINLCDLQVDLDPAHWLKKPEILGRLVSSLEMIEKGFTRLSVDGRNNSVQARVYRKIFDALDFFRRSFHSQAKEGEPAIFLATAFEMLLTDSYSNGVKARLARRYGLATASLPDAALLQPFVTALYAKRSETVHEGKVDGEFDLRSAQKAFAYAFIGVVHALDNLPNKSSAPIAEILDDRQELSPWQRWKKFIRDLRRSRR